MRPTSASEFENRRPTLDAVRSAKPHNPRSSPKLLQTQGPKWISSASPHSSPWDLAPTPLSRCRSRPPARSKGLCWTLKVGSSCQSAPPTTVTTLKQSASSMWLATYPRTTSHAPSSEPSLWLGKISQGLALQPLTPTNPSSKRPKLRNGAQGHNAQGQHTATLHPRVMQPMPLASSDPGHQGRHHAPANHLATAPSKPLDPEPGRSSTSPGSP